MYDDFIYIKIISGQNCIARHMIIRQSGEGEGEGNNISKLSSKKYVYCMY